MVIETKRFSEEVDTYGLLEENQSLKRTLSYFKTELERFRKPPLVVCDVLKLFDKKAVIRLSNGNTFLVNIANELLGKVKQGDRALCEQKFLNIVDLMGESKKFDVENLIILEKPKIKWNEIGGLNDQINELKEVIELPLKNPELFKKIGVTPPKGVLLYGVSGTGKTLLGKAAAASTNANFIEIVGSELVQKFIGEGARLVRDIFKLAREKAPCIVFIDEIDSIASERVDIGTSGEREVQRTFMQLLSEIDGFNNLDNVKIIGATNRVEILDTALLRPGRFDRLIEVPLPNEIGRKEILKIHSKDMKTKRIQYNKLVKLTEGMNGAELRAICTEAGYFAIREKREIITFEDFINAVNKIGQGEEEYTHLEMFG